MPQFVTPPEKTKRHTEPNLGELLGTLWMTKNIELDSEKGRIRLTEKLYSVFNNTAGATGDADMELPVKFLRTDADNTEKWWALCQNNGTATNDGLLFKTTDTIPTTGWVKDDIASSPTDCVDNMEIFGKVGGVDRLVVARDTDLAMLNQGTWYPSWWDTTLVQDALSASHPHPIHTFGKILLVPDGNLIHTIDNNLNVSINRLVLPEQFEVRWIADDGRRVFIGTKNTRGGESFVFPWNGSDQTYGDPMRVYDQISYAGCALLGVMHIINGKGQLMKDNGIDFQEIASLPCKDINRRWLSNDTTMRSVHPNGMKTIGDKIHILLNAGLDGLDVIISNMHSGIWVYDPKIGFYLKHGMSVDNTTGWGTAIFKSCGAIEELKVNEGRFLVGCSFITNRYSSDTIINAIFSSRVTGTGDQRGYFITTLFSNPAPRNFWKKMILLFKALESSTDRIIVKYRVEKDKNFPENLEGVSGTNSMVGTWNATNNAVFTSTHVSLANALVGMEVEILNGHGNGATAQILTITSLAGTYTITLDEDIPNVAGSNREFLFRISNFKKAGTISSQSLTKQEYLIMKYSSWVQFKIELRGNEISPEIEKLLTEFEPMRF